MGKSLQPADPHASLRGAFDVEAAVEMTPASARTKGMFFVRLRAELDARFDDLAPHLIAPPRGGRYLVFADYPSRDHVRLIDAVAVQRFPHLGAREAHRRLGVESFGEFARSTIGRVALGLLSEDVGAAMRRFGEGHAMLVKGTAPVRTTQREDGSVLLVFTDAIPVPEYLLGIIEAIITRGGRIPAVSVTREGEATHFDVRWL